ncbi:hypothetical protein [Lentibacillus amyloliquefaciens]|uniref:Uncharacterized protein n=1 Tax=Lentibacillus amyloliquefaciens TaxID=1472767 RepID=A0A0U4F2N2_9BACI|nr:hypothetical protein [Lentibacillus amyloliquefaciens]ALX49751.1 hypothetical protein AOX59_14920 [Lentibacillus amyloliquefaciens]
MRMKDKLLANVKAVKSEDNAFEAFKKRFFTVMGDQLAMTDEQLRQIYDGMSPYIETSIYAEMEDVLAAIRNAYHALVNWVAEETAKASEKHRDQSDKHANVGTLGSHKSFSKHKQSNHPDEEEQQSKGESSKQDTIQRYMNDEKSFNWFVTHVVTNYQSLPKQRIDVLVFRHEGYQHLELTLFGESFIQQYGFRTAYHFHNELMKAFHTTFDDLLAKGTVLTSDQAIQEKVLASVLKRFEAKIAVKVGDDDEQAESL